MNAREVARPRDRWGPALLFGTLWFVAAFYFWGDLGKWTDDWSFHARDPATGVNHWAKILNLRYYGFWRPLHVRTAAGLQTLLWRHDWAIHLIVAGVHALNGWLLWRVLRRACISRQAAAAGALLFLVCPVGHEAIYWVSTIGTGMGLAFFLMCAVAVQRYASREIGVRELLWYAPLLVTIGWWYEQPAASGPTIALAYLATASAARPLRGRLWTAAVLIAAGVAAVGMYAVIFMTMAVQNQRGNAESIVTSQTLWPHVKLIVRQAYEHVVLMDFGRGALEQGWRAFWSKRPQAIVTAVIFVGTLVMFASWWMQGKSGAARGASDESAELDQSRTALQRTSLVLFGLGIVAASLSPLMIVETQWFCPRLGYIPALGLIVVVVALVDGALGSEMGQSRRAVGRIVRGAALGGLSIAMVIGAVMLVGVQSAWNLRRQRDDLLFEQMRALMPNPPAHAVFVPVKVRERLFRTGSMRFDGFHYGPTEASWPATFLMQHVYGRDDVYGFAFNRWARAEKAITGVRGATPEGVVLWSGAMGGASYSKYDETNVLVPWDRVVAFTVGRDGRVSLMNSMRIEYSENSAADRVVRLSAVGEGGAPSPHGSAANSGVMIGLPDARTAVEKLTWLMQAHPGEPAGTVMQIKSVQASGRSFEAIEMHPATPGLNGYSTIVAEAPAAHEARRLTCRIGMSDYLWKVETPLTDGVGVSVWVEGQDEPVFHDEVTPARLRAMGNWITLSAGIPAMERPIKVRVEVDAGPAKNANYDWCMLTPPVLVDMPTEP